MPRKTRLDTELVRRGMVRSRSEAARAIEGGLVLVKGVPAGKAAALVDAAEPIAIAGPAARFVSRGGDKLDRALERLRIAVAERRWADAGASTGGFTDCLLQRGATSVVAIDVGYGQLDWRLRNDPRVVVLERTNVRSLSPSDLPWRVDGVVADLAFISLALVLPALIAIAEPGADFVVLVKPQFELDRRSVGPRGVVRSADAWRRAIRSVAAAGQDLGLGIAGACASPLPGPAGNREFFLHLRGDGTTLPEDAIDRAISEVPA
ncbi:MAG TPA: TlyA family RNA methyltransferase [Actinomycetota bacterium]|nr:TlyA family RNA methyltransferase [Actinomycetota bacterium]